MTRLLFLALSASLAFSTSACKKEKAASTQSGTDSADDKAEGKTAAAEGAPAGETGADKPGGTAAPSPPASEPPAAASEVRPPVAEDLATYTSDLAGDGPLVATLETSLGTIHCELFDKGAPVTVANFVGLARGMHAFKDPTSGKIESRPYYDGTVFHRVIPEFMIQGGDPTASGSGDPGYEFATEVSPDLKHVAGTLSMANAGPNTNGSQFFITETAKDFLDGKYNVFGRCKELDVVKKIARVSTAMQPSGGENSRPVDEVKLVKVTISRGAGEKKGKEKGDKKKKKKEEKADDSETATEAG